MFFQKWDNNNKKWDNNQKSLKEIFHADCTYSPFFLLQNVMIIEELKESTNRWLVYLINFSDRHFCIFKL